MKVKFDVTPEEYLATRFLSSYFIQAGLNVKGVERTDDNEFMVHVEPSKEEQGFISEIIYKVKQPSFMTKEQNDDQ